LSGIQKERITVNVQLIQIEIADGLAGWRVLGFLHGFFKFLGEDIFFVGFLEPGVRELVFALALLFGKDLLRIAQVHIGTRPNGRFMR